MSGRGGVDGRGRELSVGARAAWALGLTVAAAYTVHPLGLLVLFALSGLGFALSRRLGALMARLPAVGVLAALAFAINAAAQSGHPVFPAWSWSPSWEGLRLGALMAARLVLTVLAFGWLLTAVSPASAADALGRGLGRLPGAFAQGLALTSLVALRFGPLAAVEGRRLRRAVAMRAGRRPGLWAAPAIVVPLVLSASRRADRLAYVLAARHYGVGPRTKAIVERGSWRNGAVLVAGLAVAVVAILLHA